MRAGKYPELEFPGSAFEVFSDHARKKSDTGALVSHDARII
jgi:hypothetical protein